MLSTCVSLKDFETLCGLTGEIRNFIEIISLKSQDNKELAVKSETSMHDSILIRRVKRRQILERYLLSGVFKSEFQSVLTQNR